MKLRLGHPRAALIFAPHPDDEAIGAAGLIAALRRRGTKLCVIIVSDGAASHTASRLWPEARLVAERRRESRRALRRLGMNATALSFLDLADGSLKRPDCDRAVRRAIARQPRLDLIVGPASQDAHPDHRAVAAAIAAAPPRTRRLTYRVWPPRRRHPGRVRSLVGPGGPARKRSILRGYRTQTGAIRDDPAGFAIARHELDRFAYPIEYFLEAHR